MIPKIIHYCWFGRKPLPKFAKKCINSWKRFLPEYEIKEWNEDNFNVNIIPYTKEAYEAQKYAFVSDYARLWVLYYYGGIYFDTDVEVIKSFDYIISQGSFMGSEENIGGFVINPGLGIAAIPGLKIYKELLDIYSNMHFINDPNQTNQITIVHITTNLFTRKGYKNIKQIQQVENIKIYPPEYFAPKNILTNIISINKNTYSIHHYDASWIKKKKINLLIRFLFGRKREEFIKRLYYKAFKKHVK